MKKYQYILLDWDGNLARTLDLWLNAYRKVLAGRGFPLTDEEVAKTFGDSVKNFRALGVSDPEKALDEIEVIARRTLPDVALYPDALEVLEALHARGKTIALITSSVHQNVDHLLEKYNIARFFKVVIAADDCVEHKPHPEPLEKALTALGGSKEEAIMIGDSSNDLGAARNFGVDSILFYPPEHKKFYKLEKLKELEPTYIFEDFKEVLGVV